MTVDWSAGYAARWRLFRVNSETWADAGTAGGFVSASVECSCDGDAPLVQSGRMTVEVEPGSAFEEGYYRLSLTARQDGSEERADVATLLCSAASGEVSGGVEVLEVAGSSVLAPAAAQMVADGEYAPAGCDGAAYAAGLLRRALHAPVSVEGGFELGRHMVHDLGSTLLEAAWAVLRAGGFVVQVDGRGRVAVAPQPSEPSLSLDAARARLLSPQVGRTLDYSGVPNRYTAVSGAESATAANDDPESPTSHASRGYWRDVRDDSPAPVDGETLAAYAARRLEEESAVDDERVYERGWWPGVLVCDVVRASLPGVGLEGDMTVTAQSVECGPCGATVTERAARKVATWRRT